MLQSTVDAAFANVPPGALLTHKWDQIAAAMPEGSPEGRLALRFKAAGCCGLAGRALPPSMVDDLATVPHHVAAPPEDRSRYTTGVFRFNPRDVTIPILNPVEAGALPQGCQGFWTAADEARSEKRFAKIRRERRKLERKAEREAAPANNPKKRKQKKIEAPLPSEAPGLSDWEREKALKLEAEKRADAQETKERSIAKNRRISHAIADRMKHGQRTDGGVLGGHRMPAMAEVLPDGAPFRSAFAASLGRIPAATDKKARGGDDKIYVNEGLSKCLTLDKPYVQLLTRMVSYIIQELDSCWESIGYLMAHIARLIPDGRFWPNLITCKIIDGVLIRPHLTWWLPPNAAVLNDLYDEDKGTGNKKAQAKFVYLLRRVQRGICDRLGEIGADPLYAHHGRTKNPLCLIYATFSIHDNWMSLADWRDAIRPVRDEQGRAVLDSGGTPMVEPLIDMNAKTEAMVERSALRGFKDAIGSQRAWIELGNVVIDFMKNAQRTRNPAFLAAWANRDTFGEWLATQIRDEAMRVTGGGTGFDRMLRLRCRLTRRVWKLDENGLALRKRRGRDCKAVVARDPFFAGRRLSDPVTAERTAKSVGGTETGRIRRETSLPRIAEAIAQANMLGLTNKAAVVKRLIATKVVSRSYAYQRYDAAVGHVPSIMERIEREEAARLLAYKEAENAAKRARNRMIYAVPMPVPAVVHDTAHDKKQDTSLTTMPVRTTDLISDQPTIQPVETIIDPVNTSNLPADNPSERSSGPGNDDPRPIIARSRHPLSQQLWAAVGALRASHLHPDRLTLH